MVGWGMGHNLEKNLRKVEALREKGQLERALKQLQEWARKHPDTPHYLFEAAIAAFDLKDWGTGITALRTLLRNLPDTREKVLAACQQRFDETPAVPLAEFLVEAALTDARPEHAVHLVSSLESADQAIYARKTAMRHESAIATPQTPEATIRNGHLLQIVIGCAVGDGSIVANSIDSVLEFDAPTIQSVEPLLLTAAETHPMDARLRAAHARCLLVQGEVATASEELVDAARRDAELRSQATELLAEIDCDEDARGRWLRARADLALLDGDGAHAAQLFLEAADADAALRDSLVERLATASQKESLDGREEILKLHLRLLVVQKRFDQIAPLAQQLIEEGFAEPQEMRALLGEGQTEELPSEMLVVCAETALHDGDLAAAANHIHEIPNSDEGSLARVSKTIEQLLPEWDAESALQLEALQILLLGRMKRREAANQTLAQSWSRHPEETETLVAVTQRCADLVAPQTLVLRTALAACADAGKAIAVQALLAELLPDAKEEDAPSSESPFGESPNGFSQDALSLDFGGIGEPEDDDLDEIGAVIVDVIEEKTGRGPQVLDLLEQTVTAPEQRRRLRHAFALAALWSQAFDRALGEFAVLTMMASPSLLARVGEQYDLAIAEFGDDADLLMARADLHTQVGSEHEKVDLLARALAADPRRAEELIERFDALLEKVEGDDAPDLWEALAEALFAVQRFDRLEEICVRAQEELPESALPTFLVLRARMWLIQGRFSETLQSIQQHLVANRLPAPHAVELLEEAIEANPGSPVALLMLGQAATRANDPSRAFDAYVAAIKLDASLDAPVSDQIQQLAHASGSEPQLLLKVSTFHRDRQDHARAAEAATQALQLEPDFAERILGEFAPALAADTIEPALLAVAARAARLSGQCSVSCAYLRRLHEGEARMFETVLAEYRQLRERFQNDLAPVEGMVQALLDRTAPDAAVQVLVEVGASDDYDLEERVALLAKFHERLPDQDSLTLELTECLARTGQSDAALTLLRGLAENSSIESTELARVSGEMQRVETENAGLRLLHHDLLRRAGQPLAALEALPVASALADHEVAELSDRLLSREDLVYGDERLLLSLVEALCFQDKSDAALDVFQRATHHHSFSAISPVWMAWAGLLHENGRDDEARDLLLSQAVDEEQRREAYQNYGRWSEERAERELEALRQRYEADRTAADVALELGARLITADRADEAREVLASVQVDSTERARRGLLLGRAQLLLARADLAEATLLDAIRDIDDDAPEHAEMQLRLAECADRLGRPAQATARFQSLISDPKYQALALARARATYGRTLNEAAGEDCAALTALSSL